MEQKENDYLLGLDTLRFFAAIAVVIFHFGLWSWPIQPYLLQYFKIANLGVSFFFVLSGFIMFYVYKNTTMDKEDTYNFLVSRFSRILPLYLLSLALSTLYLIKFESIKFSMKTLFYHLFFIQSWIPGEALTLNFVNWTLSIELLFYLLFPLLFLYIKKSPRPFFIFTIFLWLISNVLTIFLSIKLNLNVVTNYEFIKFFPVFHLNNFFIGMTASYCYINKSISKYALKYLMYLLVVFFLIYPLVLPEFMHIGHHNGLFAPLFAIIILYILNSNNFINKFLELKPLLVFGKSSYGVYLLQAPVYWFVYLIYKKTGIFDTLGESFRFYVFLITLVLTSILSYYFFEKRVMIFLRKVFFKKDLQL